ncbi:MAG: leucine-rich repeat domain-containing protein [Bacteroidales bacterium]|nr:leucine-rich repeat domain-containing protein [Bacteroidales bacterium]
MNNILSPDKTRFLCADKTTEILQIEEGITTICREAFDNAKVASVVLPEGVKELESNSFLRAHRLKSIYIPSSLKIIGDYAFHFCDSLEKIELGSNTEYLGKGAFFGCENLKEIVLNGSFNWDINWIISSPPFGYLKSITKFESQNSNFLVYDDMLFSADKKVLFRCPVNKTKVNLPKELESISNWAFYNCRYLQCINLPESLTYLGSDAFSNCSSLREIRLPDSLTEIQNDTFSLCTELAYIQFPQNLSNIHKDAFFGCSKLEFFYFPLKKEKKIRGMIETSGFEYVVHSPLAYTEMAESICWNIKLNEFDEIRNQLSEDCQLISLGQRTISNIDEIVSFLKKNLRSDEDSNTKVALNVVLSETYQRDCIEVRTIGARVLPWHLLFTLRNDKICQIICGDIYIHQRESDKRSWEHIEKQLNNTIPPIPHQMPCIKCGLPSEKLTWIEYHSGGPMGGRVGNLSVCPNCKEEIQFFETLHYRNGF